MVKGVKAVHCGPCLHLRLAALVGVKAVPGCPATCAWRLVTVEGYPAQRADPCIQSDSSWWRAPAAEDAERAGERFIELRPPWAGFGAQSLCPARNDPAPSRRRAARAGPDSELRRDRTVPLRRTHRR